MVKIMIRVGTDIVEVARISRAVSNWQMSFLQRVFTEQEIRTIYSAGSVFERASGFWAAKESVVKAIGYGFRDGIRFHDIEVQHDHYGCPVFYFTGRLKEIFVEQNITHVSLSISHCRTHAIAVTVIT